MKKVLRHLLVFSALAAFIISLTGCGSLLPVRTKQDVEDLTALEEIKGPEIDYAAALKDGAAVMTVDGERTVKVVGIGEMDIHSGKVIACDPLVFFDAKPFSQNIIPGTYPVKLALIEVNGTRRNALAAIVFSEKPSVRWENAKPDETAQESEENEIFAYGVDSGTGSFLDSESGREFLQLLEKDTPAAKTLNDQILAELDKKRKTTGVDWAKVTVPGIKGSFFIFGSGEGDGAYASYFGFDESGNVTMLVTDFGIISSLVQ
ncbi:MAG: DUF4241 domain-containing protein [Acidobacteria bacterium]|nr:DUF4241 domain-containing protein [Acidobacteriota bacterium]